MMNKEIKQVPYGVSDFIDIMTNNMYYVDKTMYLPILEKEARSVFFTRPRRFGKSLFISMLRAYYDCKHKNQFNELFGNLWIGKHPTPSQGRYQVLFLDFSQVGGDLGNVKQRFDSYCGKRIDTFIQRYSEFYPAELVAEIKQSENCADKLDLMCNFASEQAYPLYLVIDEYDNFTNTILNEQGEATYHAITHADGFYRDLFKKFKGNFERIFMTGVSPVTLDDVTSGFNIGWNITMKPDFNDLLGFSTSDVRKMFQYYKEQGLLPATSDIENIINDMKPWYDGYCFSDMALQRKDRVFNSDMILYYLRNFMSYGCAPKQMIDPNTKTDYGKMRKLLQFDKLDNERKSLIRQIAEEGQLACELLDSFSAYQIPKVEIFPSLLFYYGMLTIKGTRGERMLLGIPNNNVRKQYYDYLLEEYQNDSPVDTIELGDCFYEMAYGGKWQHCLQFMADAYAKVSAVRDSIESERNLQGFFMAYFSLTNYYYTAPELELNHGFCDFFLLPDLTHYQSRHCYILELKMLHKGQAKEIVQKQWNEAVTQINSYAQAPRVEALRQGTQLHKIIMQFEGYKLIRMEEV